MQVLGFRVALVAALLLAAPAAALDAPAAPAPALIDAARAALASSGGLGDDMRLVAALEQQSLNLELANALLHLHERRGPDPLGDAVAAAALSSRWQADTLGLRWADAVPTDVQDDPRSALLALAARHDARVPAVERERLREVDALPPPVAGSLARLVDAFLAWDDADASESLMARERLLLAAVDLRIAVAVAPMPGAREACAPLHVPPAFSLDLAGCDTVHHDDVALLVDVGGHDSYLNNAGGSNLARGSCSAANPPLVAALVDLAGDDAYGDSAAPRGCGANGGGWRGAGLLVDASGDDRYTAAGHGTNGGGQQGVGLLLDASGDDVYVSTGGGTASAARGVNGGGASGAGLLVDGGGNDAYSAGSNAVNGGGHTGVGALVDLGGDDVYSAGTRATTSVSRGANGGGYSGGVGLLVDLDGHDRYLAGGDGANGGGFLGVGFLLDGGGHDAYAAGRDGTNGGGSGLGVGALLDAWGDDVYVAGAFGTNGGGAQGFGLLVDADGRDRFEDPSLAGGACWDCSIAPKGFAGAQLDRDLRP